MSTARPPDYDITAFDKDRQTGAKVGAAWNQEDGSISLVLNPGSALIYGSSMIYKLRPRSTTPAMPPVAPPRPTTQSRVTRRVFSQPDFDDDIPF